MKSSPRSTVLRLVMSLGAIAFLLFISRGKLEEAWHVLRHGVSWQYFFVAAVMYFLGLVLLSYRLQSVFAVQEIHLGFGQTFYLGFLGLFFNLFLPSAVGGDIAKAYYAYKYSGRKMASTTSVLLDRLLGFVALIFMAFVSVVANPHFENEAVDKLIYAVMGLMVFSVLFFTSRRFAKIFASLGRFIPSEKWKQRVSEIYHSIYGYKKHKRFLLLCVITSLFGQAFFIMTHYFMSLSLGIHLSPWIFFTLVPVIAIASMAPSLGGLGVREAAAVLLFQQFMPAERALALSVLLDMLLYGFSLTAGILFTFRGELRMKNLESMEETK